MGISNLVGGLRGYSGTEISKSEVKKLLTAGEAVPGGETTMDTKSSVPQDVPEWTFTAYNHIRFGEVTADCGVVTVDLVPESKNKAGTVHGGLLSAMADCAASAAARADGADYVTQSATLNYLRNTSEGIITAKATVLKRGRQTAAFHIEISDQNGILLTEGSVILHRVQR